MKIAFTGSHCTGKTTLLNQMKIIFQNADFQYVTEVARGIINRGYPLNMDANMDSYVHYINDQLKAEKRMQSCDLFISDRTLLDPLAYALVNKKLPRPYIHDYFIDMMESIWLLEKEQYDLYIYFPIEFPLIYDGVRPEDEQYRKDIDDQIAQLLKRNNVNFLKITGSPGERCDFMERLVKSNILPV